MSFCQSDVFLEQRNKRGECETCAGQLPMTDPADLKDITFGEDFRDSYRIFVKVRLRFSYMCIETNPRVAPGALIASISLTRAIKCEVGLFLADISDHLCFTFHASYFIIHGAI